MQNKISQIVKYKKRTLLFFLGILFTGTTYAQSYSINANLTGFKSGTKFYLEDVDQDTKIDSAILQNNTFILKGQLAYPPQNLWVSTVVDNKLRYFTLFIGNESITVKGDAKDFPFDLSIKGSTIQDAHNELMNLTKNGYKQYEGKKDANRRIRNHIAWHKNQVTYTKKPRLSFIKRQPGFKTYH